MTRREFLNDLYRRLGNLSRAQAEQHLMYYAEMLADRMEEGMSEEEAVASMEDVETIASRILQDEGCAEAPRAPEAPRFPDMPKGEAGQFTHVPKTPRWDWRRPAQIALWALAIAVALGSVGSRFFRRSTSEAYVTDSCEASMLQEEADYCVEDEWALNGPKTSGPEDEWTFNDEGIVLGGVHISPKGIEGDTFSITSDGIYVTGGEHEVYVGPEGVFVNGAEAEHTPGGVLCGTWEFPAADVDAIRIDWLGGEVAVRGYDGETIRLQQYADELLTENQKLAPCLESGELFIDSPSEEIRRVSAGRGTVLRSLFIDSPPGESRLLLLLPWEAVRELSVGTYSSSVELETVAVDRLHIGTTSGNVSVSGAAAKTLSIETSSGGVSLRDAGAESVYITGTSGDIRLENVAAGLFSLNGTSGDVTGSLAVQTGSVSTSSGDVTLTVAGGELYMDTSSGQVDLTLPEGAEVLNVDTTSGDVRLDWPGEHGFLLTYDTSSGRLRSADITFSVVDDFYSWGDGSCQLYVDTSSGDLTFA